jgi:hypothetical protein
MCPGVLVTDRIRLNDVPAEEREYLVEAGVTAQVSVVEVGVAAVTEPNVGWHQREARFGGIWNAIVVLVKESLGVEVRLPLVHGQLPKVETRAGQADRSREAVHEHIVPLIENRNSPITIGKTRKREVFTKSRCFNAIGAYLVRKSKAEIKGGNQRLKSKAEIKG